MCEADPPPARAPAGAARATRRTRSTRCARHGTRLRDSNSAPATRPPANDRAVRVHGGRRHRQTPVGLEPADLGAPMAAVPRGQQSSKSRIERRSLELLAVPGEAFRHIVLPDAPRSRRLGLRSAVSARHSTCEASPMSNWIPNQPASPLVVFDIPAARPLSRHEVGRGRDARPGAGRWIAPHRVRATRFGGFGSPRTETRC
jgi:hypothetical protein